MSFFSVHPTPDKNPENPFIIPKKKLILYFFHFIVRVNDIVMMWNVFSMFNFILLIELILLKTVSKTSDFYLVLPTP